MKWVKKCRNARALEEMVELASHSRPELKISADCFDAQPYFLNVRNGTLDLRSGQLLDHDPTHLLTRCCPVAYDPTAECPAWDDFLATTFPQDDADPKAPDAHFVGDDALALAVRHVRTLALPNPTDTDGIRYIPLRDYIQRAVGYSLTGETSEQVFFVAYGSGENGKSKFVETLMSLMGLSEYAVTTDLERFSDAGFGGVRNLEAVARLHKARLATATESTIARKLNTAAIKKLTGEDTLDASFLYQGSFSFRPIVKLWFSVNHLPIIEDASRSIWRRVRIIPFDVAFSGVRRDQRLSEKLQAELPGILNWAVHGARSFYNDGGILNSPAVQLSVDEYQQDQDPMANFFATCLDLSNPSATAGATDLYTAWCEYCRGSEGRYPGTQSAFGRKLKERNIGSKRRLRSGYVYDGIRLLEKPMRDF